MTTMIPIDHVVPHPYNIRTGIGDVTDLAASINSVGIMEDLVVFEAPKKPGTYIVIAGHRRLAAARLLGKRVVPCTIRKDVGGLDHQLVLMLVENLQRSDLGPVEKAEAFQALRARGMSLARIATAVGLTEATVSYYLTLTELAPQTLEHVREGRVPVTRAVEAVRDTRRTERKRTGRAQPGAPTQVEPAHFTARHPLAREWAGRCHHSARPRIAGACGQCIEAVIRADERGREAVA